MIKANQNRQASHNFLVAFDPKGLPTLLHVCQKNESQTVIATKLISVIAAPDVEMHCSGPEGIGCFQAILNTDQLKDLFSKLTWLQKGLLTQLQVILDEQVCVFTLAPNKQKEKKDTWLVRRLGRTKFTRMFKRAAATLML